MGPWGAGWRGMGADLRTTGAALSQHLFNAPETAKELQGEADKIREEIARRYKPKVPSYRDIRTDQGVMPFLEDTGQWLYEGAAQSVPQMAATLGGAGVAALAVPSSPILAPLAAGTAAALPFFVGQNIQEQIKEGKSLPETSLTSAVAAGGVQGALDTLVGRVFPGVGKAASGGALMRAIKKGLEGGLIEGLTEGAQQAIQIGQANPTKLFDFSPEVQHELANAALLGMGLGGTIGGVSGAVSKQAPRGPDLPVQEDLGSSPMGPPPPDPWRPEGTGAPVNPQEEPPPPPWQPDPSVMVPEGDTYMAPYGPPEPPGWEADRAGLPRDEQSQPPFEPDRSVLFPAPGFFRTGQQVYKDVQQKLLAAGLKPMEANENAYLARARYETLGKQLGTDAWSAYQQQNLEIKGPGGETPTGGKSYNQDQRDINPSHYSLLGQVLNQSSMKQGNAQQWLNQLKKAGVKNEELEWTGFNDWLQEQKGPITKDQAIANFKPYGIAVYEAAPDQSKNSYAAWTLGGFGKDPASNYREVIVSDDQQPVGTYESGHWPKVPNPIGHYRTTERTTTDGAPVLLAEEFQSDWHQKGRQDGYHDPGLYQRVDDELAALGKEYEATPWDTQEGVTRRYEIVKRQDELDRQRIDNEFKTKDGPFKQSWPNHLFRQALFDAIRQGKDYLAWNTGDNMPEIEGWGSNPDPTKVEAMRKFYDGQIVNYANKLLKPYGGQVQKIDVNSGPQTIKFFNPIRGDQDERSISDALMMLRSARQYIESHQDDGSIPDQKINQAWKLVDSLEKALSKTPPNAQAWAVPITDQMRELIGTGGLPMFQRKRGSEGNVKPGTPQGNITITPEQTTIRLFKTKNASTFQHESAHQYLEELHRYAPENKEIAADLTVFRKWLGREEGDSTPLKVKEHEMFARGWEQYLRTGVAPTKGLQGIFEKFKQWLLKIYRTAMDLDVTVPKHIADAYGRLINQHEDWSTEGKKSKIPQGTLYNVPEQGDMPKGQPSEARTYSQSGRANVDDLRPSMLRANDNINERSWTPEHYRKMAQTYNVRQKAFEKMAAEWKGYAEKAMNDRRKRGLSGIGPKAQAFLDGMEDYKKSAKEAREQRDEYLRKEAALNSRTYNQSPVENPESTYNNTKKVTTGSWRRTKAFFDPFSEVNDENLFRDTRNLTAGGVGAATRAARDGKAIFDDLSDKDKDLTYAYMKTDNADPETLPTSVRSKVVAYKKFINGPLRQQLIDNNLISEDAAKSQGDSYLPRIYLKHIVDGGGLANSFKLNQDYARKKDNTKSSDELLALGEVKDPGVLVYHTVFRSMRDLAIVNHLQTIANNPSWAFQPGLTEWNGKKVTPDWLKNEADQIVEKRAPAETNPERKAAMLDVAKRMRDQATEGLIALGKADYDTKEWTQLPNTRDFGPLRGMIVQKQIADDVKGTTSFVNSDNPWTKLFGDGNSWLSRMTGHWKALKVPMNPPSIVRNVASNFLLANILGGVRIDRVGPSFYEAAKEIRNDGEMYRRAQKWGLGQNTFTEQEIRAVYDELADLQPKDASGFKSWRHVINGYLRLEKFAGDKYQKMEEWGKLAVFIDAVKNRKMADNDAAREMNRALFDYSEATPFVKGARQSPIGMPFIMFPYKAIPALIQTAKEHPTRFLPYVALAGTVPAIVAASHGLEDDDPEKLRKSLSENLRRKKTMMLLPGKDANGNWQFADIGYFLPWQMPYDVGASLGQAGISAAEGRGREAVKNVGEAFKSTSVLSNPLFNVVTALTTGIDPFTGRPIADKRDPANKQILNIMGYVWSLAVPSLFSGYGALGMLKDKMEGTGVNRYGEPTATSGQIIGRALGLNTYSVLPDEQRARNIKIMERDIQDVRSRMTSALRDQGLTMEQRRKIASDYMDEIKDRFDELSAYRRESEPSARLRAATLAR